MANEPVNIQADEEILKMFSLEAEEHLETMEREILALEATPEVVDAERINKTFRAAHSIKGSAAYLAMDGVKRMAHALENVLNMIRNATLLPTHDVTGALLHGTDMLRRLINAPAEVGSNQLEAEVAALQAFTPKIPDETEKDSWRAVPQPSHAAIPASSTPAGVQPAPKAEASHIRVNLGHLDKLMGLAGELVLTRNSLVQSLSTGDIGIIAEVTQRMDTLTSELQEAIMLTRMQAIGSVFNKFRRVVRDLSSQLNKRIELEIEGEEVELDKSILEAIGDPLTHLIRNGVDHGIESPQQREAAGKSAVGRMRLRAFHRAGQVCIEVEDDGGGIDPARIKAKALEKGLRGAKELAAMSDKEIVSLIFAPGFSTAQVVSDVSGRGVGMDVVQTSLAKIGGTVDIDTQIGKGTAFRIKLPLTLAIIPSLLVVSGAERFALPQVNIVELVRVSRKDKDKRIKMIGGAEVIHLRGALLPLIRLNDVLGISGESGNTDVTGYGAVHIVVVAAGEFNYGLIVDGFLDSMEIVVKPFGKHLAKCGRYAGATILGDGQVALILDVSGIRQAVNLVAPPQSEGREDARRNAATQDSNPPTRFLLIENAPGERFVIPMEDVVRIERLHSSAIETLGDRKAVPHADGSLVLLSIEDVVAAKPRKDAAIVYAVIFNVSGSEAGVLVSEVVDTVAAEGRMQAALHARPGITGAVMIGGRLILALDLQALAGRLSPTWGDGPSGIQPSACNQEINRG